MAEETINGSTNDIEVQVAAGSLSPEGPTKPAEVLGVDDPFQIRQGRDLVWRNVNMILKAKGDRPEKKILDGVWGEVPKRQVTAIIGPSGCGKTSLLNVLSGRTSTSGLIDVSSDVRLNNYSVDPTNIQVRKKIAFVAQDDSLQITSTPREAIRFSARLRLPSSMTDEQLDTLTQRMLSELGLTDCADTIVGGALLKGISGGQRKRTSVGVELVSRPALVFLDEPTSGLDSFNAVQICQVLKKVSAAGSSVMFTIHQPSSEIFNSFDGLILLNQGRVMYQGPVQDVPSFFGERGQPCPPNYNPADWVMNVALSHDIQKLENDNFFPPDNREIVEPFSVEAGKDALGITDHDKISIVEGTPVGVVPQTIFLFQREVKNLVRETHSLKTRLGMTCMISTLMGCLYFQIAESNLTEFINVQSTFGALTMGLLANMFSTALPSLVAFPQERPVFLREYSTNHYTVVAYFISRLTMELFVTAAQVTISTAITYNLMGFSQNYGIYWSAAYLMACSSTALGVMIGSAVENPSSAIEFLPALFMPQILFSGFFVPPGLVPNWLSWIRFICPLTYGVQIVIVAEFENKCDNLDTNLCQMVIKNANASADDRWWYYLVLLVLFIFFRLLALIILKSKASKFY